VLFLLHKNFKNSIFLADLSEQELNCLLLAAWGIEVEETAEILEIKDDSVHKVRAKISQKLNSKNITHSVFKANVAGILTFNNVDFLLQPKKKKTSTAQANKEVEELENVSI
jgi:DNA-binding CsgD family transcriptional regulator